MGNVCDSFLEKGLDYVFFFCPSRSWNNYLVIFIIGVETLQLTPQGKQALFVIGYWSYNCYRSSSLNFRDIYFILANTTKLLFISVFLSMVGLVGMVPKSVMWYDGSILKASVYVMKIRRNARRSIHFRLQRDLDPPLLLRWWGWWRRMAWSEEAGLDWCVSGPTLLVLLIMNDITLQQTNSWMKLVAAKTDT